MSSVQVYDVRGMTCSSCALRVEKRLRESPDVEEATVNFASGKAFVTGGASAESLARRIGDIGYELVLAEERARRTEDVSGARRELFRLIAALALTVPLVVLHWLRLAIPAAPWVELTLASLIVAGPGSGFFIRAFKLLRHGGANMDTLVALGSGTAYLYGVTLLSTGFPGPYYFDAAGMILALILIGKYLEARATARAGESLRALMDLSPKYAARIGADGKSEQVLVSDLQAADRIRVGPGERIPVDGQIVSGRSQIDESLATGESVPVGRGEGDPVLGGTINGSGVIELRATALGSDSFLAQMVRLVEEAQGSKPPIQRLADTISGFFVPAILLVAAATGAGWYLSGHSLTASLLPAMAVVLIACPCALGLATPTAVLAASGLAARQGMLVRNGAALEGAARLDLLVADKTGTLTEGRPKVVEFLNNVGPGREGEALALAAALERGSEHPIGRAILENAETHQEWPLEARDVVADPGEGISGMVEGKRVRIGTFEFARKHGADLRHMLRDTTSHPIASRAYLMVEKRLYGVFYLEDAIRPDAAEALAELRELGLEVVMATGDNQQVASYVGSQLGLTTLHAAMAPRDKKALVERLRAGGHRVGMVGDGVNDAPALAGADVGFAIGTGTDVALQSADITLVGGDLSRVARAVELSKRTLRIIRQNLFWAFFYNAAAVPVAALGYLRPQMAAAAMALSSICVVTNSLRLQRGSARRHGESSGGASAPDRPPGAARPWMEEREIPIEGMTCEHCAQNVAKALRDVVGVEEVEVDLERKRARVRFRVADVTMGLLKNAIRGAGYKVPEPEASLRGGYYANKEEDFRIT